MPPAKRGHGLGSWSLWRLSVVFTIGHLLALGTFSFGFLLTRIELPNKSSFVDSRAKSCSSQPPVQKVVWMIIDALRWDFVENGNDSAIGAPFGAMPILHSVACAAVSAATCQLTFNLVADLK